MSSDTITLKLTERKEFGKAVKAIRREGLVPANIYERGKESQAVSANFGEITKVYKQAGKHHPIEVTIDGSKRLVLIKDVDLDVAKNTLIHVAFHALKRNEKTEAEVPVRIADVTQDSLRTKVAYVPQEPALFHRSIKENIRYAKTDATDSEVTAAAKLANADEFIQGLPNKYDTEVGERGVMLSGGQRQRIAIARAVLKDAPILILDEATSALDSKSEKLIQASLTEVMKGRTTIVVAHRLSTIQKLDRIVVIENGKIAEQGSHNELVTKNGIYAKLWKHQSGGFIEE